MGRNYKDEYEKFQDSPSQLKKRAALNRANHKRGTYGNNDGLDVSHTEDGIRFEKSSINKGRKEKSRMKGSKRKQQGGYLKGKSHKQGGIAAVVGGQEPVELEGGEYIIRKSSVDKLGKGVLEEINKKGRVPTMANGGKAKKYDDKKEGERYRKVKAKADESYRKKRKYQPKLSSKDQLDYWNRPEHQNETAEEYTKRLRKGYRAKESASDFIKRQEKKTKKATGGKIKKDKKEYWDKAFKKDGSHYKEPTGKEVQTAANLGINVDELRKLQSQSPHRTKYEQKIAKGGYDKTGPVKKTRYKSKKAKGGEVNVKTRRPPTTPGKGLHSEDFTKGGHFYEELTDKEKKAGMKLGLSKDPDKAGRKYRKLKSKSPHRTKFQQMIAPGQADDPTLPWEKGGGLKKTRYTSKSKKATGGEIKKRLANKKQMGGMMQPQAGNMPHKTPMRTYELGGQTSTHTSKAAGGDPIAIHSHSGYKAGE